ncbi:MAG: biotin--[acetyl-CoA-carboxylase] ligase [Bacillota bacterium]|jgi:BirA family biotin operon repressor/biotin-[acetyl-CoA-carboxylase] ligase
MSILRLLLSAYPNPISGEQMAKDLTISRSAVWKKIKALEQIGIEVSGKQNSGYRLERWPNLMLPELLMHFRKAVTLGEPIYYQESIGSTNDWAKQLAQGGATAGTLVVAEEQTAGRGRRGRSWLSQPGAGIFASLVLRPSLPPERIPLLTLTLGIALVQTLREYGLTEAWLKWPNDVWVGRKKLAGILAELAGQLDQVDWVVLGMGINTHQAEFPAELAAIATSYLRETGQDVQRAALLCDALHSLERLLPLLQQSSLDGLMEQWQSCDRLIGQQVRAITPSGTIHGQARGITANGALVLRLADGSEQTIMAGDVSLRF